MKEKLVIGTRGSSLALRQAELVAGFLHQAFPKLSVETKIITTTGDKILDQPLAKIEDKGLFTKEIENALLNRKIDIAVHSMKDMQTLLPPGLDIGAVLQREDPRDALISKEGRKLSHLPAQASIGTGSPRRIAQVLHLRQVCCQGSM